MRNMCAAAYTLQGYKHTLNFFLQKNATRHTCITTVSANSSRRAERPGKAGHLSLENFFF